MEVGEGGKRDGDRPTCDDVHELTTARSVTIIAA